MRKPSCDTVLSTTLKIAKIVNVGDRFQASRVRDLLGLPHGEFHGEAIRECWRRNRGWLKNQGLQLVEEPKKSQDLVVCSEGETVSPEEYCSQYPTVDHFLNGIKYMSAIIDSYARIR